MMTKICRLKEKMSRFAKVFSSIFVDTVGWLSYCLLAVSFSSLSFIKLFLRINLLLPWSSPFPIPPILLFLLHACLCLTSSEDEWVLVLFIACREKRENVQWLIAPAAATNSLNLNSPTNRHRRRHIFHIFVIFMFVWWNKWCRFNSL